MVAVSEILGLDPQESEFTVVYDAIPTSHQEIAILSRSMMQILSELASYIEVPEKHIAEKRVEPTRRYETAKGISLRPLIQVHSRGDTAVASKPDDAFAAVKYHKYWFWVDDTDLLSKKIISFLLTLFSIAETGGQGGGPIVTIPAG